MEVLEESKVFPLAISINGQLSSERFCVFWCWRWKEVELKTKFKWKSKILPYRKQLSVNSNWKVFLRLCELLIKNPIKFPLHVLLHNCSWVLLYKYYDAYKNFPLCVHRNLILRLRLFGLSFTFWLFAFVCVFSKRIKSTKLCSLLLLTIKAFFTISFQLKRNKLSIHNFTT